MRSAFVIGEAPDVDVRTHTSVLGGSGQPWHRNDVYLTQLMKMKIA